MILTHVNSEYVCLDWIKYVVKTFYYSSKDNDCPGEFDTDIIKVYTCPINIATTTDAEWNTILDTSCGTAITYTEVTDVSLIEEVLAALCVCEDATDPTEPPEPVRHPDVICLWDGVSVDENGKAVSEPGFIDFDTSTSPSTPAYYLLSDPTVAVTGYTVVPCVEWSEDWEQKGKCRDVLTAGAGYSVGDEVEMCVHSLQWVDVLPIPSYTTFYNYTTMAFFVPEDPSHLWPCQDQCDPGIISGYADTGFYTDFGFNVMGIKKPECCDLAIVTTAGTFNLPVWTVWIDLSPFKCLVEITSLVGDCLDEVHIVLQRQ